MKMTLTIRFTFSESGDGEAVRYLDSWWEIATPFGDSRFWGNVSELKKHIQKKAKLAGEEVEFK